LFCSNKYNHEAVYGLSSKQWRHLVNEIETYDIKPACVAYRVFALFKRPDGSKKSAT